MAKVGRPLIFETAEAMQKAVTAYFDKCDEESEVYTVLGLALALGMVRKTLLEYEERGEFRNTVKKAKARVELSLEHRLSHNAVAGTIFNLKNNFGWKDKTETELTGPDGGPLSIEVSFAKSKG